MLLLAVLSLATLLAAFGGVAQAAPEWQIRSSANTSVAPGGSLAFTVWARNVGDTPTSGTSTVTVELPPGLTFASAQAGDLMWDCSANTPGDTTATCTTDQAAPVKPIGPTLGPDLLFTASVDPDAGVSAGLRTTRFTVSGGGAAEAAETLDPTRVTAEPLAFGIDAFDGQVLNDAGNAYTQAGGRPYTMSTQIDLNRGTDPLFGAFWPVEPLRDVVVDLPVGLVGNPQAVQQCSPGDLANTSSGIAERPLCPPGSQIGVAMVKFSRGFANTDQIAGPLSVYNIQPPGAVPARFGFNVSGTVVTLDARLRSATDYGISIDVRYNPEALAIIGTELTLWGVPADDRHDPMRSCPGDRMPYDGGPSCGTDYPAKPFLRLPTMCSAPVGHPVQDGLVTRLSVSSWDNPGRLLADGSPDLSDPAWKTREFVSHDSPGYPGDPDDPSTPWGRHLLPQDCGNIPFDSSLAGRPMGGAAVSTPTAFAFDLTLPQGEGAIGTGDLKKAVVTLPAGVRVSPSSAYGLAGCSSAQIGLRSIADPTCPDGSKLGTVRIDTPLLEEPLRGLIYLASPFDNPFNSLIGIYLVARGPGTIIKLPGHISPDPQSGQLTATFDDNPQVPFDQLHLEFKGGPRAPIVTPDMCGDYTTNAQLTSWSGKSVSSPSTFSVSADGRGGACPATRAFAPKFHAGTVTPKAGTTTPFNLAVTREDRDQQLGGLTVEMPPGLLGKIKNATLCSDGAAARGTCGEASRVGSVTVGAGAGPNPFYITNGRAYITEGYRGGSYGLSIVVPAVAGPFDLGDVNVRAAIHVDRSTAQLRVVSDPLPTILEGIPLDVRDVRVKIDKPDFIVNPTNCTPTAVNGSMQSTTGATAGRSTRFQVGGCRSLDLRPRMSMSIGKSGRTGRGASVPFTTVIRQAPGQSNLRSVRVTLPMTVNARLNVVNRACTRAEYDAGNCEKARAGTAKADTPLLAEPLSGGAYFVRNRSRGLPDLMVALRGPVAIDLVGTVTIPGSKRLATTFSTIPDAPITRFELKLVAGSKGPVGAAANLCTARSRRTPARVSILGQNGDLIEMNKRMKVHGCARHRAAGRGRRRGRR